MNMNMPGLTGKNGGPSPTNQTFQSHPPPFAGSGQRISSSPVRPPVEPLSPILGPVSPGNAATSTQTNAPGRPAKATFTHSQEATQYVAQPVPKPISLEENPDAIALRAAISILQIQKRRAEGDLITLQTIQSRAREDPESFRDALSESKIPTKSDGLFNISKEDLNGSGDEEDDDDDEDSEDEEKEQTAGGNRTGQSADEEDHDMNDAPEWDDPSRRPRENGNRDNDEPMPDADHAAPSSKKSQREKAEKWPPLPPRQNIVRMPPINWSQYAVVGESLDKLHEDQRKNPADGVPPRLGSDGRIKAVEGGNPRSQPAVIAAPYNPFKDKVEKKKTGKR